MAVFSKLFQSVKTVKKGADRFQQSKSSNSTKEPCCLNGLKIKAKLLLPILDLPDPEPAINLFNAINWEKRKGKPLVSLTLSPNCLTLSNNHKWALSPCGDTIFQLAYKDIVSVDVTKKKNEVAITFKRGDKYFWVICLKLKGIKGETPLSRHRKITGEDLQQLITTLQFTYTSQDECLSKESSSLSLVSTSDSFFYIDFNTSQQPLQTADDSALVLKNKVDIIVSRSVSCPILVTVDFEQNNDSSQQDDQPEISSTESVEQEEVVDYSELLAKHSECCNKPCDVTCPMYPVENDEFMACKQKEAEMAASRRCSSNNSSAQPLPDAQQYAYYWDSATGQYMYYPLPTADQHTASPYVNQQCAASQLTPNTSSVGHSYGQAPHSSTEASDHYAACFAQWYQQYSDSYYGSANSGYGQEDIPDLQIPMTDRRRRQLARELQKRGVTAQQLLQAFQNLHQNAPPTYSSHYYGAAGCYGYNQPGTSQPTVTQSDYQSHSSASPLVNGSYQTSSQYETSSHSAYVYQQSPQVDQEYGLDMNRY